MRTNPFCGTGVAVITPFTTEGEIDVVALRTLIERLIEKDKVDFLCALGTTAETPTLSEAEKVQVIEIFVDTVRRRVPLLLGFGGNNTSAICAVLENTDFEGIDGVLIVTPYYNKPTQEGLYRHYCAVAKASPVPVMLYNVPSRTGVNMTAETTLRIARACENVVAIKEASGNLAQFEAIIADAPEGFGVLSGDDSLTLSALGLGAVGVVSVVANAYGAEFAQMVRAELRKDHEEALRIHRMFRPVYQLAFVEGNPAGVKCFMAQRGEVCNVLRLPLLEVSAPTEQKIVEAIKQFYL